MTRPLDVQSHMGLVVQVARRYARGCRHLDIEDLIQEGVCGLMVALEKFDPERGCAFSTYAMHWIRAKIRRAIQNTERSVRVPTWRLDRDRKEGVLKPERAVSLDTSAREDAPAIADVMPSGGESPEDACERRERERLAHELLDALAERERAIVLARFFDSRTLEEVGDALLPRVTRERIRQIEAAALEKMRRRVA